MADGVSDKKANILEAALRLISEHGFHGTPMSLVAREAQVGVGTIYRYFSSKEELINALYLDLRTHFTDAMLRGDYQDNPIRARFANIWFNLAHYCLNHPRELRFIEQYSNSPYLTALTKAENARVWQPIMSFIKFSQEQQVVKDIPPEILLSIVFGSVVSLVKLHMTEGFPIDETILTMAMEVAWDGVKR